MISCRFVPLPSTSNQPLPLLKFRFDCRIHPRWSEGHEIVIWPPETLVVMFVGVLLVPPVITRLFVALPTYIGSETVPMT